MESKNVSTFLDVGFLMSYITGLLLPFNNCGSGLDPDRSEAGLGSSAELLNDIYVD